MSFHLLQLKFDNVELRWQLVHWSLKFERVERQILQGISCRPRLLCGINALPYTVSGTGTLDGFKDAVNRRLLP